MAYTDAVLVDAPIRWWRLGDDDPSIFIDSSGNGEDGTWNTAAIPGQPSLLSTDASDDSVWFNGLDHYGHAAPAGALPQMTIEAWIKLDDHSNYHNIAASDQDALNRDWIFRVSNSGHLEFAWWANHATGSGVDALGMTGDSVLTPGVTYHVAVVFDNGVATLYRDSVPDGTVDWSATGTSLRADSSVLWLGQQMDGYRFAGYMDEVAIYDQALTQGRLTAHYAEGALGAGYSDLVLAGHPLAYYRLGGGFGGGFADSSGNGRDMTIGGTPVLDVTGLVADDADTAADFDGDGYAYAAGAGWQAFSHFTCETLIQPSALSGDNIIAGRTSFFNAPTDTGSRGWHLITKDDHVVFGMTMTDGTFEEITGATALVVGDKHHVAVTWDGTTAKILLDGVVDASSTTLSGKTLNNISGQALTLSAENGFATLSNYHGVLDEMAFYDQALDETVLAEHASRMGGAPAAPVTVNLGFAEEVDEAVGLDLPFTVNLGTAQEADEALGLIPPLTVNLGVAEETDEALALVVEDGPPPTMVFLGKAVESEEALELNPIVQTIATTGQAREQEIALPLSPKFVSTGVGYDAGGHLAVRLGIAQEREQSLRMHWFPPRVVEYHAGQGDDGLVLQTGVWIGPGGVAGLSNTLVLDILEREPMQAPTSIVVSVGGAIPARTVDFHVDGVLVWSERMPDGTGTALFSVPVPEAQGRRGEHVLEVDQNGATSASAIFTLKYDPDMLPTDRGPDAPPVEIPESIHPSGVRRWVLQDLMPGGLGSYVMPLNPSEMDNPAYERVLTAVHTTAVNEGQFHVSEGAVRPLEWSFKGYCPTEEMAETLRAYAELKRRFYIHDHRGRAWIVVITQADIVPRLQQRNIYGDLTDWVHDYTVNAVIFDRAEF